ncbi:TonB-linked outer membrane protein, SusC/RagA family [Pedobacter westerhofensis]|uniref:TonB-linked outer membrane protein, SusC/RagA family n=1 Tax=Pedobacter westerhofensis TaxID=425512 RepID=A0A521BI22_9SPHI|nr:TonB-dependent receptor [Pedobacter westerhofensis]SMO46788.1 TonB-linked outer membrane protein, SusC/RagA family [Pedobacter westerhofensis]
MKVQLYTKKAGLSPVSLFSYHCVFGLLLVCTAAAPAYSISRNDSKTKFSFRIIAVADITVKGTVTDEKGQPLPGASVKLKNAAAGTVTDTNGNFSLNVPDAGAVLQISYTGYELREVTASATALKVQLQPNNKVLSEVVVVGYGTSKKANLTTAISSVKGDAITERPTTLNVLQGLAGKAAGVNIMTNSGKPGGNPAVKIRGTGSINSSNSPLYVVDGVVGADPNSIDPSIVASVDIYKDAGSTAIYGSRGANGVIVITTKTGNKNTSDIAFNNTVSFGTLQHEIDLLDAPGALEMLRREYDYVPGRLAPHLDPSSTFARKNELFNADGTPKYNTDWQKEATQTAISHQHSLTFSGGKDDFSILANISYKNNEGIMLNSYAKQINGYINVGWDVKPWLNLKASLNVGGYQSNNIEGNTLGLNAVREMYEFLPFMPVQYADGTYSRKGDYPGEEDSENPVKLLKNVKDVTGRISTLGNIVGTFHLAKHLNFVSSFSGQLNSNYENYFAGNDVFGVSQQQGGVAQRANTLNSVWSNEDYFSYDNTFGKHHVNAILGASWYDYITSATKAGSENFFDNTFSYNNLGAGTVIETPFSSQIENQLNSFYSRVNYDFDNKYLFGASFRADGSSKFRGDNLYGYFPAFNAGWRVSNESFFEGLKSVISDLKLRGSYGLVGNQEIGNYPTVSLYNSTQSIFNQTKSAAVTLSSFGNPDLKWEKSAQLDLGLDIAFLNGRIELSGDYYNKVTKDLIYFVQQPATTGYGGAYKNLGSIRNRGMELTLNTQNIVGRDFKWNSSINFSVNRSKVLDINHDIIYPWGGRIIEGGPLNEFFGYVREGVWTADQAAEAAKFGRKPGDVRYADLNNNGMKDAGDRTNLGNAMPKWEGNFTNTFTYKNISLFVDLEAMYGNKLLNLTRFIMTGSTPNVNSYSEILGAYTPQNQNSNIAQLRLSTDSFSDNEVADSHYIENGSFLRVRNIALNYRFNKDLLKKIKLSNLSVGVNVENAFLFTKYKGYDPEATSFDASLNQGVDVYQYPKPRTIALSINANF